MSRWGNYACRALIAAGKSINYADAAIRGRTGAGHTILTAPSAFAMPAPRIGSLASGVNS